MRTAFLMMYLSYGVRGLMPLVIAPFLIRALGPSGWGTFSLLYSFCLLMAQIVEFGFGLTGTREIALHRDDRVQLSRILTSVLTIQLSLTALIALASYPIFAFVLHLRGHTHVIWAALIYIFFQGATPLWFFRGLEKLVLVASFEIAAKLGALLAIPLMVHSVSDIGLAITILACSSFISSATALILALRIAPPSRPRWSFIRTILVETLPLFGVRMSGSILTVGNTLVLGTFAAPIIVGYFSGIERIITGARLMMNPAIDTIFPKISRILAGKEDGGHIVRRSMIALTGSGVFMSLAIFVFAKPLVAFLFGSVQPQALAVTYILAIGPTFIAITHAIGTQWILPMGYRKRYSAAIIGGAIANFAILLIMLPSQPGQGHLIAAGAQVVGQFVMAAAIVFSAYRTRDRISVLHHT